VDRLVYNMCKHCSLIKIYNINRESITLSFSLKIKIKNPKPFIHIKFPGNTEFTGNTAFWRHCLKKYWFTIKILLYYWKDEDTNLILRKHTY